MYQLVYVSTAAWKLGSEDLNEILDISRGKNRQRGVTGILLHLDQGFLQVLEGPKQAVRDTFDEIVGDHRHTGLRILVEQDAGERLFGDWNMGFDRPRKLDANSAGAFELTLAAIEGAITPEKSTEIAVLLRNFYRVNAGNCAA